MKTKKLSSLELKKLISERAFKIFEANEEELNNTEETGQDFDAGHQEPSLETNPSIEEPQSNSVDKSHLNNFDDLGDTISNISSKLNPIELEDANSQILKAISSGKVSPKYDFTIMNYGSGKKNVFDYFVSVLAAIYKNEDSATKNNIRKVLFLVFPVYEFFGRDAKNSEYNERVYPSSLTKLIAKKSGINHELNVGYKTIDSSYYIDIIADAVYESIDTALEKYNPNANVPFSSFFLVTAANKTKDKLNSKLHQKTFSLSGQKASLDEPIDNKGEEPDETKVDRITGQENEQSTSEVEAMKSFAQSITNFVQDKLSSKPKLVKYLEFFNLFTEGYNLSEIADTMNVTYGNVRVIKKRMEDFITQFVESGDLQDYINERTGLRVNFPNNKFTLSATNSTDEKQSQVEPVEYFNITGNDPQTGEPTGEWVSLTPSKGDSETSWFDKYGDLVNWSDKETEPVQQDVVNDINDNEAEQLREHLAEALAKFLKRKLNNG
jgi:DNA-directed RNA polymerase specialized sigma24 family protein